RVAPMDLDDHVCLCFRVSQRKLRSYVRVYRPRVASQLSECGGAGTGCGWCVPLLQKLFVQASLEQEPTAAEYAARRAVYLKNKPPQPDS
ncbi:MAG: (2Fe-2S)-binding protein, partial [Gemmataceae bacterium]